MKTNYQNENMLDMIFENRNKSYGAYALRISYNKTMRQALFISVTSILALFFGKLLSDKMHTTAILKPIEIETMVELSNLIEIVKPAVELPVQPKPEQAQAVSSTRDVEMRVVANNNLQDSIPTNEEKHDLEAGLTTVISTNTIGVVDGIGDVATIERTNTITETSPPYLITAEVMPQFPGGDKALMKFLSKNTEYPRYEREMEISGKVVLKFIVNEDGSISKTQILKGTTRGFEKEAVRVVSLLPHFKPGLQQGKPVKVQFVLPFTFTLND